jgi:hypothetical protein
MIAERISMWVRPCDINCTWVPTENADVPDEVRCSKCGTIRPFARHRNCSGKGKGWRSRLWRRLGWSIQRAIRYEYAVYRWMRGGWRTRKNEEVLRILEEHCKPCEMYWDGTCHICGCLVNDSRNALRNKIKMADEHCPIGKW